MVQYGSKNQSKDLGFYKKKCRKFFGYFLLGVMLFFLLASWGVFGSMPSFEDLENPEANLATEIISADGVTIGKFYNENRTQVKYNQLPKHLIDALVATEDERFYEHSGIDFRRTTTAIASLGTRGGASTITQQLAKLLFHGEGSKFIVFRLVQKVKEWIIAARLERQYTKNEIIAMYLNKADFVNTAVGIRSAAKVYFGKEPKELTVDESAMLVGMLKNPSLYNPVRRAERTQQRRNLVLKQMERNGYLTEAQKDFFQKKPLVLNFNPESHFEGTATYFREYLRNYMKKWVQENKKPDGSDYDIYSDGLKIYTTIDSRVQKYAEKAVSSHLANLQEEFDAQQKDNKNKPFIRLSQEETDKIMLSAMKNSPRWRDMASSDKSEQEIISSFSKKTNMKIFTWKGERDTLMTPLDSIRYYKGLLQAGLMAMEPQTGHIKAWVGGNNYKYLQYDHVGQGARQVGSTFKAFVYAAALDQLNMSPCDSIIDSPHTIPAGRHNLSRAWTPANADHGNRGMVTLKKALALSINTISAKLIDRVGPDMVVDLTKRMGVSANIPSRPSIALGAVEITVHDMVGAYSTFANKGVYIKPEFITRIEDKNGLIIYEPTLETKDVLSKDIAFAVVKLLEGVTESGSGARLRSQGGGYRRCTGYPYGFTNPIAGKTGTTQNQSDGWFVGMVPNLVTGVWVGCEDRAARFRSTAYGQGAATALPIWALMMKACYKDPDLDISQAEFEKPENLTVKVDCYDTETEADSLGLDLQSTDEFEL